MTQESILRTQHRGQGGTSVGFQALAGEPTAIPFLSLSFVLCFGFSLFVLGEGRVNRRKKFCYVENKITQSKETLMSVSRVR